MEHQVGLGVHQLQNPKFCCFAGVDRYLNGCKRHILPNETKSLNNFKKQD